MNLTTEQKDKLLQTIVRLTKSGAIKWRNDWPGTRFTIKGPMRENGSQLEITFESGIDFLSPLFGATFKIYKSSLMPSWSHLKFHHKSKDVTELFKLQQNQFNNDNEKYEKQSENYKQEMFNSFVSLLEELECNHSK